MACVGSVWVSGVISGPCLAIWGPGGSVPTYFPHHLDFYGVPRRPPIIRAFPRCVVRPIEQPIPPVCAVPMCLVEMSGER